MLSSLSILDIPIPHYGDSISMFFKNMYISVKDNLQYRARLARFLRIPNVFQLSCLKCLNLALSFLLICFKLSSHWFLRHFASFVFNVWWAFCTIGKVCSFIISFIVYMSFIDMLCIFIPENLIFLPVLTLHIFNWFPN